MMTANSVEQYCNWYNEAAKFYDDDERLECIETTKKILADGTCPRYHHIRALILLGGTLDDWEEANECYIQADLLWCIVRRWQPKDQDEKIEKTWLERTRRT